MSSILFISGPCGCGKTTLSELYARQLAQRWHRPVYLIHGDDFHAGFVEPGEGETIPWKDILRFNWDCLITTADRALLQGMDVVIDYVIEEELPRVRALADRHGAALYYVVLTASAEAIEGRIRARGDVDMIDRALFLKEKLEALPENQNHLLDNTGLSAEGTVKALDLESYRVN